MEYPRITRDFQSDNEALNYIKTAYSKIVIRCLKYPNVKLFMFNIDIQLVKDRDLNVGFGCGLIKHKGSNASVTISYVPEQSRKNQIPVNIIKDILHFSTK